MCPACIQRLLAAFSSFPLTITLAHAFGFIDFAGWATAASPASAGEPAAEMQAMRVKLQKAKRTLDNMKKREADAIAAKEAAEAKAVTLQAQADKAGYLLAS